MALESDQIEIIRARVKVLKKQIANCEQRISLLEGGNLPKALTSEKEMRRRLVAELDSYQSSLEKEGSNIREAPDLRTRVERALARLYPPGFRFPESQNPIMIKITELDEAASSATIDLGACTFEEGSMYGTQISSYLKKKFPELRKVSIKIMETD